MMMSVEQSVKRLEEETKILGESLPQCRFIHHKSHMTSPGIETRPPRWEASNQPPQLRHGLNHGLENSNEKTGI
jgi:hypothetical protein